MSGFLERLAAMFRPAAPNTDGTHAPETMRTTLHGVPVEVINTRADIATADVLARLDESLALIDTYQPWRLAHLRRDIRGIRVERFACRGAFMPQDNVIITELTFLARRDISAAPVASSILHEGVHARVHAMGVYRTEENLPREERLCRRAELAFGQALPPELGVSVIERAMASLALEDRDVAPIVDWREAQRRQDAADHDAMS
ncbi:hypothetical protein [Gemmatimonas sp.]|uniref:hypothetical protein n=1 Tax=Gemmatimonas sp. TaxID=1962908 RepID=UPI003561DB50